MSDLKVLTVELINQHGRSEHFQIRNDSTLSLIELIQEAGVASPYGCLVGSCGTCVVEVIQGEEFMVPRTQIEEDTLSRVTPEVSATRLICRATLASNVPEGSNFVFRKIEIV